MIILSPGAENYVSVWDMFPDLNLFSPFAHPVYPVGSFLFTGAIQADFSHCIDFFVQHIPLTRLGHNPMNAIN